MIQQKKYTVSDILNMYNIDVTKQTFHGYEEKGLIPKAKRMTRGKTQVRYWTTEDLPLIGKKFGYLSPPKQTKVVTFYTRKGGTGKTPQTFNFGRILALHGIRTLLVGLDSQESLSASLNGENELESLPENIDDLYTDGLYEVFKKQLSLNDVIVKTDIEYLDYIPENAGLAEFVADIDKLPDPLKVLEKILIKDLIGKYDYILLDCNPVWDRLINSVLYSTDLLISPLSCRSGTVKIVGTFFSLLSRYEEDTNSEIEKFVIPSLLKNSKISRQARNYFESNFSEICSKTALKDATDYEESDDLGISLMEYKPSSSNYKDLMKVLCEFQKIIELLDSEEFETNEQTPSQSSNSLQL